MPNRGQSVLQRSEVGGPFRTPLCTWTPPNRHVRGHAVAQMLPLGEPRLRDLASDPSLAPPQPLGGLHTRLYK